MSEPRVIKGDQVGILPTTLQEYLFEFLEHNTL